MFEWMVETNANENECTLIMQHIVNKLLKITKYIYIYTVYHSYKRLVRVKLLIVSQ